MGRFTLSFKVWWRVLRDPAFAEKVQPLFAAPALPSPSSAPAPIPEVPVQVGFPRSDALNLLAVLQREARLVDFLKEDVAGYTNEQIGAAVRDVHRDAGAAVERIFGLKPVIEQPEGSGADVPAGFDAGRLRLVGNVAGRPPYRGTLRHAGWEASRVQLPQWSGAERTARVVAPAEVEL